MKIKPLIWEECNIYVSTKTIFGNIQIDKEDNEWQYCFQEYYDEASIKADSIEDAKAAVLKFYLERLLPALED